MVRGDDAKTTDVSAQDWDGGRAGALTLPLRRGSCWRVRAYATGMSATIRALGFERSY